MGAGISSLRKLTVFMTFFVLRLRMDNRMGLFPG